MTWMGGMRASSFPKELWYKVFHLVLTLPDRLLVRSFKQKILQIKMQTFIVFDMPGTVLNT